MPPFAAGAIEALTKGKDGQGHEIDYFIQRRPDWWGYLQDSILLDRQGAAAAALYGMDVDSPAWKEAQRTLSTIWKKVDLQAVDESIKLALELGKLPQCAFLSRK